MRSIKSITLKDAKKALSAMEDRARELGKDFSFCILDALGTMILFEKMDNAPKSSTRMAMAKAETSLRQGSPTRSIYELKKKRGFEMASFSGNCITEVAGGLPVYYSSDDLEPAGALGVSGPSQDIDEEVARVGLEALGVN